MPAWQLRPDPQNGTPLVLQQVWLAPPQHMLVPLPEGTQIAPGAQGTQSPPTHIGPLAQQWSNVEPQPQLPFMQIAPPVHCMLGPMQPLGSQQAPFRQVALAQQAWPGAPQLGPSPN